MPFADCRRRFRAHVARARSRMVLLGLAALLPLSGCSQTSHGDRVPLTGTVSKGGQPLQVKATIYFDPVQGETGVGSSGEVVDGKFAIPAESGPTPGMTYKVTVITAPGIPAEGTPREQIKVAERYETTVNIPPREESNPHLDIEFD